MMGRAAVITRTGFVEWAVAERCMPGEQVSGDLAVVLEREDGVLIAVVDGLGHGYEAAAAAGAAVDTVTAHRSEEAAALLQLCHEGLRRTRGAAVSIATIHARGSIAWAGVGNVEGRLLPRGGGPRESIVLRGGIVGYRLPSLRVSTHPIAPGDVLVFATDGLASCYADDVSIDSSPSEIAEVLLLRHARDLDDALVLVARIAETPA
jgi:serine/threonine protein phosphatase PrpC